jgi:hypothetical protein
MALDNGANPTTQSGGTKHLLCGRSDWPAWRACSYIGEYLLQATFLQQIQWHG